MTRFLLSCVPVALLVAALTGLRLPAWKAALAAFAVCVAEALAMRAAPARDVALCAANGAATGIAGRESEAMKKALAYFPFVLATACASTAAWAALRGA